MAENNPREISLFPTQTTFEGLLQSPIQRRSEQYTNPPYDSPPDYNSQNVKRLISFFSDPVKGVYEFAREQTNAIQENFKPSIVANISSKEDALKGKAKGEIKFLLETQGQSESFNAKPADEFEAQIKLKPYAKAGAKVDGTIKIGDKSKIASTAFIGAKAGIEASSKVEFGPYAVEVAKGLNIGKGVGYNFSAKYDRKKTDVRMGGGITALLGAGVDIDVSVDHEKLHKTLNPENFLETSFQIGNQLGNAIKGVSGIDVIEKEIFSSMVSGAKAESQQNNRRRGQIRLIESEEKPQNQEVKYTSVSSSEMSFPHPFEVPEIPKSDIKDVGFAENRATLLFNKIQTKEKESEHNKSPNPEKSGTKTNKEQNQEQEVHQKNPDQSQNPKGLWKIFSNLSNPLVKFVQKLKTGANKSQAPEQQNKNKPKTNFLVKSWGKLTEIATKFKGSSQR